MKLVVSNSEATLAFRAMAADVLRFIAGERQVDLYGSVRRCADALDEHGGVLTVVDFKPYPGDQDQDMAINLVIHGVLHMVASTMVQLDTDDDEYQAGLSAVSRGIVELNRLLRFARRDQ